jgi:hypothetical protein
VGRVQLNRDGAMISRLFCATGAVKSFHWVVSIGVGVGTLLGCGSLATAGVRPAAFQNTGEGPAQDSLPDPRQLVGGSSPGNPPTVTDQTVPLAGRGTGVAPH